MNKTLARILAIIIAVSSTLLVRPTFWKICFKKMPLPEGTNLIFLTAVIIGQLLILGIIFCIFFFSALFDSKLIFFNGSTVFAIVVFLVNIWLGNYILSATVQFGLTNAFKGKNFLITFCVLVVFSVLTIVLNVQFAKVTVPTTKTEAENLGTILEDESIAIEKKDLLTLANTNTSFLKTYASNGKIIYWDANSERKVNTAVILQGNKCFVKRYDKKYPSLLESHKEIGYILDDKDHLYRAYAIIKYRNFKFYVDHYTLYDYENDELIECKNLPTWATNK